MTFFDSEFYIEHHITACRCYLFDSTHNTTGTFKSPNYPVTYPADVGCILYRFQGRKTELVKLTFWSFKLRNPQNGRCIDYLDVFASIDTTPISSGEAAVDQMQNTTMDWKIQRPADYRICGGLNGLPQKKIYSVGSVLYLVFHSESNQGSLSKLQYGGFIGQFWFELKELYRTNAVLQPGTRCTYHVEHHSEHDEQFRKGNFFSPQFPSNYPPNLHCKYRFTAVANERIVITFQSIRLGFFPGESQPWNALR
ncbi:uncharacterized protein DEA37_0003422 [Paragonimus westermani]|uniref:CUB domain-containing protein n=1 Tax=Paragonimus westermani TaxID=34504 RepID=A0A5J4NXM2_9TREM|nr:uncharacterized protein DEA37_0003422 [Paragonimus westermani]